MRCIEPAPLYENKGVREYAEFRLLAAASDLKEVDPDSLSTRNEGTDVVKHLTSKGADSSCHRFWYWYALAGQQPHSHDANRATDTQSFHFMARGLWSHHTTIAVMSSH
jgi:hypothetical protein